MLGLFIDLYSNLAPVYRIIAMEYLVIAMEYRIIAMEYPVITAKAVIFENILLFFHFGVTKEIPALAGTTRIFVKDAYFDRYFTTTLGERLTTSSFNSIPIPGKSGILNLPFTG